MYSEVREILQMWFAVENAYNQLSAEQRKQVELAAAPLGHTVRFFGFSANEEIEHHRAACNLIDRIDEFQGFKGVNPIPGSVASMPTGGC